MDTGACNPLSHGILWGEKEIHKILTTTTKSIFKKIFNPEYSTPNSKNRRLRLKFKLVNKFSGCPLGKILEEPTLPCRGFHEAFPSKLLCAFLISPSLLVAQLIGILNIFHHPETSGSIYYSQGNGPIRHVETCPDFFFSLQEYTQRNPLSKF
jgi:hypothetical protein